MECNMLPYISEPERLTEITYNQIYHRIERIALVVAKWENLPDGVTQMILERYLFFKGRCAFFYDDILAQYMVLPVSGVYVFDQNGLPAEFEVTGWKDYRRRLTVDDSVLIFNGYDQTPTSEIACLFASRITNALRTSDVHLENQKLGKIISVPETKKRGVMKLLERVKNFHLYTIASPAASALTDSVSVLDTELEYIGDKIDNHYLFLWHECMSYLGVDSMTSKLSGVSKEETRAESFTSNIGQDAVILPRREAAEKINEMFGLDVQVNFNGRLDNEQVYADIEDSYRNLVGSTSTT